MGAEAEAESAGEDATVETVEDPRGTRPTMRGRQDFEMDVIGWVLFLTLAVLLIPLLPALLLGIALGKLLGIGRRGRLSW